MGGLGMISIAETTFTIVVSAEVLPPTAAAVIFRSDRPDSPPPRS
jgi:hypothetical protein